MANKKADKPSDEGVAEFSGAMDELVQKYDSVINEFKDILDAQTQRILNDPKLDEKKEN